MGELRFSDKLQLHNWQQSQTILCSEEDYGEFIVTFLFSSQVDHIFSYAYNTIILVYFSITPKGWRLTPLRNSSSPKERVVIAPEGGAAWPPPPCLSSF
jgi:hypothetical protein